MTAMADPYMFVPEVAEGVSRSGKSPQGALRWSPECHAWTAPSLMAGINSKVVYRSMHLLQVGYPMSPPYVAVGCVCLQALSLE